MAINPLYESVRIWRRNRDGREAQYQGKGEFCGWQTIMMCHGLKCEDKNKVTMHGKDIIDVDDSALSGMVEGSFHDDYGKGTQNLVRHLAQKNLWPNTERHTR